MTASEPAEDRVFDLLDEADMLPNGPARVALLEEAVRIADTAGDVDLGYSTRLELINAAEFAGHSQTALVAFTWCLAQADKDPEQFPEEELFWMYKWIVGSLPSFPDISRRQIEESLADMTRRLQRAGYGLKSVYKLQHRIAKAMGDHEEAEAAYRRWQDAPHDDNEDCPACNRNDEVKYLAWRGEHERALDHADPLVVTRRMSCAEVPHGTYGALLPSLLKLGRVKEARQFHEEGLRMIGDNGGEFQDELGLHLAFLAVTGDFAAGLKLLEKTLHWPFVSGDPDDHYGYFRGAWLLLDRLVDAEGEHTRQLRLPDSFPLHAADGSYSLTALRDWFHTRTTELAAAFNKRNGNNYYTEKLDRLRELEVGG